MPQSLGEIIEAANAERELQQNPEYIKIQEDAEGLDGPRPASRTAAPPKSRTLGDIIKEGESRKQAPTSPVTEESVAAGREAQLDEFKQEFKDVSALKPGAPKRAKKQNELVGRYYEFEAENETAFDNAKKQEEFVKESQFINKYVEESHPQRDEKVKDFVDRFQDWQSDSRARVLKYKLTKMGVVKPGDKVDWQSIRRGDEAMQRLGSTLVSSTAWMTGQGATADLLTRAANDLNEYNNLLDRDTVLGKKYGPLFGQIASSLINSTVSAVATGGLGGVAAIIAMDEFNVGMEETKDMDIGDRLQHGATRAVIGGGVTLAGGALAAKAGVASGETVVPFAGKVFRDLFTRSGLMKTATAAVIEGGEEGVQTLLTAIEDVHSGANPNAADNLFNDVVGATAVGAFVGGGVEHLQNIKLDSFRVEHLKGLQKKWMDKLRKNGEPTPLKKEYVMDKDGNLHETETSKAAQEIRKPTGISEYVRNEAGQLIRMRDLDVELEAVNKMELAVQEQRIADHNGEFFKDYQDSIREVSLLNENNKVLRAELIDLKKSGNASKFTKRIDELSQQIEAQAAYRKYLIKQTEKEGPIKQRLDDEIQERYDDNMLLVAEERARLRDLYRLPKAEESLADAGNEDISGYLDSAKSDQGQYEQRVADVSKDYNTAMEKVDKLKADRRTADNLEKTIAEDTEMADSLEFGPNADKFTSRVDDLRKKIEDNNLELEGLAEGLNSEEIDANIQLNETKAKRDEDLKGLKQDFAGKLDSDNPKKSAVSKMQEAYNEKKMDIMSTFANGPHLKQAAIIDKQRGRIRDANKQINELRKSIDTLKGSKETPANNKKIVKRQAKLDDLMSRFDTMQDSLVIREDTYAKSVDKATKKRDADLDKLDSDNEKFKGRLKLASNLEKGAADIAATEVKAQQTDAEKPKRKSPKEVQLGRAEKALAKLDKQYSDAVRAAKTPTTLKNAHKKFKPLVAAAKKVVARMRKKLSEKAKEQTASEKAVADTTKFKQGEKPQDGTTYVNNDTQFDILHKDMLRARQRAVKFTRRFLGMSKVEAREAMSTQENFELAIKQGLPEKAVELANQVVNGKDGKILNSVELAGLQERYVGEMKAILKEKKYLKENEGKLFNDEFDARMNALDNRMDDVDLMTQAWIKSSSEAGAALQAQKRIYGERFSVEQAVVQARRYKAAPLTSEEIDVLNKAADEVYNTADKLAKLDKDDPDFDQADEDLFVAKAEYQATIKNFEPRNKLLSVLEKYNGVRMAMTLAGDFVPLGRQGQFTLGSNPVMSIGIAKDFFKVFGNLDAKGANHQAFLVERGLRNMENYRVLTKKYGTRQLEAHTPFGDVESSALGRIQRAFAGGGKVAKSIGKLLNKTPIPNFDIAYRAWLNSLRMQVADRAYRMNKEILSSPGGELEMQKIIDSAMVSTGHTKSNLGPYGTVLMTAPRWFLSRLELAANAPRYLTQGAWQTLHGRKGAARFIARQYVNHALNIAWMQAAVTGVAAVMYGEDSVKYHLNPADPMYGYLEAGGRMFDLTGGTGFVVRQMVKGARGAYETMQGPDKRRDADAGKSLGNTLVSRGSPVGRDLSYFYQSATEAGSNKKLSMAEYLVRNTTWLSWQAVWDAANDEGLSPALFTGVMEGLGSSGFAVDKPKRRSGRNR